MNKTRRIKIIYFKIKHYIWSPYYIIKGFLSSRLNDRQKEMLKYFVFMDFLKYKKVIKNEKWEGPLVTIITTFYNQEDTIFDTVNSVLGQTLENFEYIIVNDGSEKKQRDVLNKISDKRVAIIDQEHLGNGSPAPARNNGLSRARGKYVMCLDGDDMLSPTYLEKTLSILETDYNVDIVTTNMAMFGAEDGRYGFGSFSPINQIRRNYICTAAVFRKEVLNSVEGFKAGIGYEDWEFWVSAVETGHFARNLNEDLFLYRVAQNSRYKEDVKKHKRNYYKIEKLHPLYRLKVLCWMLIKFFYNKVADYNNAFINIKHQKSDEKSNVLITIPWMVFGGAETLIYNFSKELRGGYNISFITGLYSDHPWEYKFREITNNIYHLSNLFFNRKSLYLEFLSAYIISMNISILHIIHNGFVFEMLPEIKKRHPKLKVIVTMFNDRVNYFEQSVSYKQYIDIFTSDNMVVGNHYKENINPDAVKVIPNGIDCYDNFNKDLFNIDSERRELRIAKDDVSIFFIGRLSEEKCPDVFIDVAKSVINQKNIKFFMVGDGPMKDYLLKKIDKESISNVNYLGYQSNIAKYLAAADVFILPSRIEGFPLSVLEAMAMKTVVIASKVGAVPDVITSGLNGFVVTPSSAEEISEIILDIYNNKKKIIEIGEAARKDVENNYSNLKLKSNYISLYKEATK